MTFVSCDIGQPTWDAMKALPEWALFHPDVIEVWNRAVAGLPAHRPDMIAAIVCAELREHDRRRTEGDAG